MNQKKLIPKAVWYGFEDNRYSEIAQEIPEQNSGMRKWIAIYNLHHETYSKQPSSRYYDFIANIRTHKYGIFIIEIPSHKLGELDNLYSQDINASYAKGADDIDTLYTLLDECHADPSLFTYPWKSDYPLG